MDVDIVNELSQACTANKPAPAPVPMNVESDEDFCVLCKFIY